MKNQYLVRIGRKTEIGFDDGLTKDQYNSYVKKLCRRNRFVNRNITQYQLGQLVCEEEKGATQVYRQTEELMECSNRARTSYQKRDQLDSYKFPHLATYHREEVFQVKVFTLMGLEVWLGKESDRYFCHIYSNSDPRDRIQKILNIISETSGPRKKTGPPRRQEGGGRRSSSGLRVVLK